jgi:hypothetical protein
MNSKVQNVFIQIRAPAHGDQGLTCEGCFVVNGDTVTLTDRNGEPAHDSDGRRYSQKLEPGENPKQIAGRLTRKLRDSLRGRDNVTGFDGPISYPRSVVA